MVTDGALPYRLHRPRRRRTGAPLSRQDDEQDQPIDPYSMSGLAQSYAWLGQQLLAQHDVNDVFAALTSIGVRQVPGAQHAGITRSHRGHLVSRVVSLFLVG